MANDPRILELLDRASTLEQKEDPRRDYSLGYSTLPGGIYDANTDNIALTSGTVVFSKLEPGRDVFSADQVVIHVGATAAATVTDQRVGIYRREGADLVRLAQSAASVTLLTTDEVRKVSALTASVDLNPFDEFYFAILSVATTPGTLVGWASVGIGAATNLAGVTAELPFRSLTLAGQTALDASEAISGMTASASIPYAFVSHS